MVFEKSKIGQLLLQNRFVRSATWEGLASEDGSVTPRLIDKMVELAEGKVGLIITGHAFVSPEGRATPFQLGIYKDELIDGLKQMVEAVHNAQGKIVVQLAHAGAFAMPLGNSAPSLSPSGFKEAIAMSDSDIEKAIDTFVKASERAKKAGFDGIQLHAAHGYLLSQFLSPYFNKRTDEYGGSIENRARIIVEILRRVRENLGSDYPVLMKINSEDFLEGGLSVDEMIETVKLLEKEGLSGVEVSGGTIISNKLIPVRIHKDKETKPYYLEASRRLKEAVNIPVILVGGIRSLEDAEKIVNEKIADYVAMSRPFIREPDLIKRWQEGDRTPSRCLSDNLCFGPARKGEGIYCVRERQGR